MTSSLARLIESLRPIPVGGQAYEMMSPPDMDDHLFGGQVLAQALSVAIHEAGKRTAHSLHAYFLQRGDPRIPIRFECRTLRASRSFLTLDVGASQAARPILQMLVSFHRPEEALVHQRDPGELGRPGGETYEESLFRALTARGLDAPEVRYEFPIEIRDVGGLAMFTTDIEPPQARCWMRARGELPDDPTVHQCVLAYASDFAIMAPAVQPHPVAVVDFFSASLDHAIWFHDDFRMDDWVLLDLDSPVMKNARGLGRGLVYTADGHLVASCAQEALLRPLQQDC
jgi:acyl-CoA thioesterase-2